MRRDHERQRPGHAIRARLLEGLARAVEGLVRLRVGPGLELTWVGDVPCLRLAAPAAPTATIQVAQAPAGGIAARSGSTPGSATVTLENLSGGSYSSGSTVTCYNWTNTAVGANHWIAMGQDASGNWTFLSEDC